MITAEKNTEPFIKCKDHSVSQEEFVLHYNASYDMLVTSPKPEKGELAKYYESEDYISHTDAKRSLFEKIYHMVKVYSLKKKVALITKHNRKVGKVLDIGAGTGDFLATAQKKGWDASGVEPNDQARKLAFSKGIYLNGESNAIKKDNSFDIITMWHVLEHVPDLEFQIHEIQRLLKSEGYLIIAVPNFKSYDAKYYKSFWAGYDVPRHLWHFSKSSIRKLFTAQNFELINTNPMMFDSFYVSLLSEKYKNGKMNYLRAFWIGFLSNVKAFRNKEFSSHIYILKKRK